MFRDFPIDKAATKLEACASQMSTRRLVSALALSLACHQPPISAEPVGAMAPALVNAASTALYAAADQSSGCYARGGPTGRGKARVVYSNDGVVKSVQILTEKFRETSTGGCVRKIFQRAKIEPFRGPEPTFIKYFQISDRI